MHLIAPDISMKSLDENDVNFNVYVKCMFVLKQILRPKTHARVGGPIPVKPNVRF